MARFLCATSRSVLTILGLVAIPRVLCAVRSYEFALTNGVVSPDGLNRSAILVNQQFPGPLVSARKGDQLEINVMNGLEDTSMAQGISIHWHGLFQHRTASQDGVAWVSQCPIAAGDEFQYNLHPAGQTGTYWYHSHLATQYCDGLRGPLVIYDDDDPMKGLYDIDDEHTVLTLGDWFHLVSPAAYAVLGNPDSSNLNGLGRFDGGPPGPLSVVNVVRGLRYRFRLVNTACASAFNISMDGHSMSVIELDGVETYPKRTDIISIWPGQRISAVVSANQSVDNYWIRFVPFLVGVDPSNTTGVNMAILRYAGAKNVDPESVSSATDLMHEQDLVSFETADLSTQTPDIVLNLNITLDNFTFSINGKPWQAPPVPVLLQILNGSASAQDLLPAESIYSLPRDKLISVTIPGGSPIAPHPFHLHGHNFQVVRSAGSETNNSHPIYRDVVNTGNTGDDVTFLFLTDNPGPWLLHCHIDFHLMAGLAIVFAEDIADERSGPSSVETPKDWRELCPKWSSLTAGKQFSITEPVSL